jgi:hypothetical protein
MRPVATPGDPEKLAMKTLKISLIATVAATAAWYLRIPQTIWPAHPQMADLLLALVTCVLLEVAWKNARKELS